MLKLLASVKSLLVFAGREAPSSCSALLKQAEVIVSDADQHITNVDDRDRLNQLVLEIEDLGGSSVRHLLDRKTS